MADDKMPKDFYERLKDYYSNVGAVLRGEADAASVFPNPSDKGSSREETYAEFLRTHLPRSCNVILGGFLFGLAGDESKQIDVIVTNHTCPQYNLHNRSGHGKAFACIDGALAAVSVKSNLDSKELLNSLDLFRSLPKKQEISGKVNPLVRLTNYEEWPFKIVFASSGIGLETLTASLESFYEENEAIPHNHRPNLIHVAGQYNLTRVLAGGGTTRDGDTVPEGTFYPLNDPTDVFALSHVVEKIQQFAATSQQIFFHYHDIRNRIPF